ncbi:MAG: non-ribosomal peptide synthetase [Fusobacteriaceae bacterium]|nr:non-ribosomal peptide synthetase [Fusobacteriaceae bacterium]MBN2838067.1 non-ribosomal peptide synthetase [Fusobacteriaceae bacterium]
MSFKRKIYDSEKLYIKLEEAFTPFNIQYILEGEGNINLEEFQIAVKKACDFLPIFKSTRKGNLWVEGEKYPNILLLAGEKLEGNKLLKEKLPQDQLTRIIIFQEEKMKIVFQVFHGLADAKGVFLWVENIFKSLKNEKLIEDREDRSDVELLKEKSYKPKDKDLKLDIDFKHWKNKDFYIETRDKITIYGHHKMIVPKIAKIISDNSIGNKRRFMIPVDARRHIGNNISSNLTFPVFLEFEKDESIQNINKQLLYKLSENKELNISKIDLGLLTKLPSVMFKGFLKVVDKYSKFKNKVMINGIISHLGKVNLENFSNDTFKAIKLSPIPMHQPLAPITIVPLETEKNGEKITEIVIVSYEQFYNQEQIRNILHETKDNLEGKDIYKIINNTRKKLTEPFNFSEILVKNFLENKDKVALVEGEKKLSYGELHRLTDNLAYYFNKNIKENKVIVHLDRSIEFVLSLVALIKAGITYIPVDTTTPFERIKLISEESGVREIISKEKELGGKLSLKNIDLNFEDFEKFDKRENDSIYIIFTSGSTGIPKGCEIGEKSLINHLFWAKETFLSKDFKGMPLFSSTSVDFTVTSIFLPLIAGGKIKIYRDNINHLIMKDIIEDDELNCLKFTPSHLKILNSISYESNSFKTFIIGGEQLYKKDLQKILDKKNVRIINEYGPTEATVSCVYYEYKDQVEEIVPIGKPIWNTEVLILDDNKKPINPKEKGELYISGEVLAKGYLKEELTKDRFIEVEGRIFYKTGDFVYLDENNDFVFLGRKDDEVKISGNRVNLKEIEKSIKTFEETLEVFVEYDTHKLVAFLVLKENTNSNLERLKNYLKKILPQYMIPNKFNLVDKIEIGTNGKIDKNNLKDNEENIKFNLGALSEKEEMIVSIFKDVLEVEEFDISKDFYSLGGDSLGFILLVSKIDEKFFQGKNKEFTNKMMDIYENTTVFNIYSVLKELN